MIKKHLRKIIVVFVILVLLVFCFFSLEKTISNEESIANFRDDSKLDILVSLVADTTETQIEFSENKLLDVSMRLAENIGILNEFSDGTEYIQYVAKDDLHQIIEDLTGNKIAAPIEIEDFYYLYDSENEYYYYRPTSPNYYTVSSINSLKKHGSFYTVNCTIDKDGEESDSKVLEIKLKFDPTNSIYKYRLINCKLK